VNLGLKRVQAGDAGNTVIPTTTVLGLCFLEKTNSFDVAISYRENIAKKFKLLNISFEIFVTAGQNGSWASERSS